MRRVVAVQASAATEPLALAMLEDVVDLVEAMREVEAALALPAGAGEAVRAVTWPGMPVVAVPASPSVCDALDALYAIGADAHGVASTAATDLPALMNGTPHRALA